MNEAGKNIIQQLFGQSDLSHISRRDIETIASRYPYFGPVQLLLAKKLLETNSNGSEEQLQKTTLYFTSPYWLNYLLNEENISETLTDTITGFPVTENIEEIIKEEAEPESITAVPEFAQDPDSDTQPLTAKTSGIKDDEQIIATEEIIQEKTEPESITAVPEFVQETDADTQPIITETPEIKDEEISAVQEASSVTANESLPVSAAESIPEAAEPILAEPDEDDLPIPDDEQEAIGEDTQKVKLSSLIERHLSEFKKPVEESHELPIKASPYHTIDYFASQGIRADGQDKFSTRVRKFTDWLKQMKGANAQPADLGTDAETEHLIETIAQTSNETKDIVTEAMAEVLVKQGKTEKAIQLYKKLSFLNPAKSIYFAAKIEALNSK